MIGDEWVRLTASLVQDEQAVRDGLAQFRGPDTDAGRAAERWLQERALEESDHIATWLFFREGELAGFHSLSMGEVELRQRERKRFRASHPRQGAVLILWMARAVEASVDGERLVLHAVGVGQQAARLVGASVIAADPYDSSVEGLWRDLGFRRSGTDYRGADGAKLKRLWAPLLIDGG
jgi:hypothetical protein